MDIIKTMLGKKLSRLEIAFVFILTFFRVGSLYFYTNAGQMLGRAKGPWYFIIIAVLVSLTTFAGFWLIAVVMRSIFDRFKENSYQAPICDLKRNFIKDSIFLAVCYGLHLIMRFPGSLNCDTVQMMKDFDNGELSEHHSVLYTVVLGNLIDFAEKFTEGYWGVFIFVVLHYILYVLGFAYLLYILRKMRTPNSVVLFTKVLLVINPFIIGYIGVALKDCSYSVLVMASMLFIIDHFIDSPKNLPVYKYVLLAASLLFACLTRKNGIYVYVVLVLVLYISTRKDNSHEKMRLSLVVGLVLYCLCTVFISKVLNPIPSNAAEMLSVPFQQTARFVRDYGDEVTDEEREVIDRLLEYDDLAERYDPQKSDDVKGPCLGKIPDIIDYSKVWAAQFGRHPLCYVAATWEQNYYLFVPEAEIENTAFYSDGIVGYEADEPIVVEDINVEFFPITQSELYVHLWSYQFYRSLSRLPVVDIFWNVSTVFYLLTFFTVEMIIQKKKPEFMIPLWMTVIFVVIGPVIQGHPRYMFPIIYTLPAIICYVLFYKDSHNKNTKKSRK